MEEVFIAICCRILEMVTWLMIVHGDNIYEAGVVNSYFRKWHTTDCYNECNDITCRFFILAISGVSDEVRCADDLL